MVRSGKAAVNLSSFFCEILMDRIMGIPREERAVELMPQMVVRDSSVKL